MLGKTNIEEVLRRQKIKKTSSQKIIEQVQAVLEKINWREKPSLKK